ncbi:MAG TPA: twin-arginine translocase TatA/TatE family subunit [Acidiferrobacter sp.]|nr:twin-arginine translocase TatA/TatE family subunit [Acidiferrobacter sp.]
MFDFSFSEILIIGLVAVIVLDPRHLPEVAKSAGRWMGRARRFMNKVKNDLDGQVGTEHLAPLRELSQEWHRTKSLLEDSVTPPEWGESLGDESPDKATPELSPPNKAILDGAPDGPPRRRKRRGRRRSTARGTAAVNVRKPHGGGEDV